MTKSVTEKLMNPAGNRPINLGVISPVKFPSKPPKHLGERAAKIWKELSRAWSEVLTGGDVKRFEKHCIVEALFQEAYEENDTPSMLKYLDRLEKGYTSFGGTPLSRLKFRGPEVSYTEARKGKVSLQEGRVEELLD